MGTTTVEVRETRRDMRNDILVMDNPVMFTNVSIDSLSEIIVTSSWGSVSVKVDSVLI
jgi:hypothetical protein